MKKNSRKFDASVSGFYGMIKDLGYSYKTIKDQLPDDKFIADQRIFFASHLIRLISDPKTIFVFYDSTIICEGNFKKKGWAISKTNPVSTRKFNYNKTHLLLMMTNKKLVAFQVVKDKVIGFDIILYFNKAIKQLKKDYPTKRIAIVLDNATMHKTLYFLNFLESLDVTILYTVRRHPLLNPVEYLIRYLKKNLRKTYGLK